MRERGREKEKGEAKPKQGKRDGERETQKKERQRNRRKQGKREAESWKQSAGWLRGLGGVCRRHRWGPFSWVKCAQMETRMV